MVVRIRGEGRRLTVPCPLGLARFVVWCIPQRVFDQLVENSQEQIPQEDRAQAKQAMDALPMDKKLILDILDLAAEIAREYKGLEIVHVESSDGDTVSIVL